jgi:YesN/AraC family two-component response regulator
VRKRWRLEREQGIEILITDINMPKMDGYELVESRGLRVRLP